MLEMFGGPRDIFEEGLAPRALPIWAYDYHVETRLNIWAFVILLTKFVINRVISIRYKQTHIYIYIYIIR